MAWLLLAGTAQAATLSGFVTDADNGEALTRVIVAVKGLQLAAISNNSGYYAVVQVPAGTHVVSASHLGYQTRWDTLRFDADEAVRLDLALVPKPVDLGEQVSVETDRISLRAKPLQQLPALGEADLLRGLQLLPGVQAVADISSGLYVRGGGPDQTAILLDQTPLYNPSHLFGLFSTFNPDAIKEVNLYKGAYPAPSGRTLGAVLDVRNREGNRKRTSGRGGVSLISGRLLTEGPVGQGSWMLAGRRTYLDGVFSTLRARGEDIPLNYYFYDLNGNINQRRGDDSYTATAYWGQDDLRIELEDDEESFVDMRWGNRALTARWTRAFSPALFGHFTAASSEYESIVALRFLDAPLRIANSIRDLSLKGDLDYFANHHHTLSLGFLATLFEFHFVRSFNDRTQLDLRQEPVLLEGYVQDEWRPGPTTQVRLGGRGTYFSAGHRWHFTPRLFLSQALSDKIRVKAAAGIYRQHLQLITTETFSGGDFWVPLDSTVEPGRSYQAVTGVEWTPSQHYQLSVEAYYTDLANLVTVDTELPDDNEETHSEAVFKSGGTGWASGVEVFLQRRTGALTGWIGYALGWTRRTFPELNDGQPFPPKHDRRHDLSFVASYEVGAWRLGASLAYASGQAFTPVSETPAAQRNSTRLQPYHRLDVSASRSFGLWGAASEFYVQIFNVYSRRNEWFVQLDSVDPEVDPRQIKQLPIIPSLGFNFSF